MPVIYSAETKTARMTASRDDVASGTLILMTSADSILATFALTAGGGTVTGDVWTLAFTAGTVTAGASGTATKATIRNSGTTARITGLTVGTTGTDVVLDNNVITSGQSVTLTSATITHAPDPS